MAQFGHFGNARIDKLPIEPAAGGVAEDDREDLGGIAVIVVRGRSRRHLQEILLRGRLFGQLLKPGLRPRRLDLARAFDRFPIAAGPAAVGNEAVEIDLARRG